MDNTTVNFDEEVFNETLKGAEIGFKSVSKTMGRHGGYNAINDRFHEAYLTKDGYYSIRSISLEDKLQNQGLSMLKIAAKKTADDAEDGTSTTTVLTYKMFEKAIEKISKGNNASDVMKGMNKACSAVKEELKKNSEETIGNDQIKQVATISANNNEEIGGVIAEAMSKIKLEGSITVEQSKGMDTTVEVVDGMKLDSGYADFRFVTNPEKMVVELKDAYILIYDDVLTTMQEVLPVMEFVAKEGKALLIIAIRTEQEALASLIVNKIGNDENPPMKIAAVNVQGHGATKDTWLKDIATVCGATVISQQEGVDIKTSFVPEMLGTAKKVKITSKSCELVDGGAYPDDLKERITTIKNQIKEEKHPASLAFHKERLAKIDGGVAVINIGANTEVEMNEKKDLYEDAIGATKAAVEEGIVPGGGASLVHASKVLDTLKGDNDSEQEGIIIVKEALCEPLMTIMGNAGLDFNEILANVKSSKDINYGYNLSTNEYCDMVDAGILDTAKVGRVALENAVSISSMMFSTKCVINSVE